VSERMIDVVYRPGSDITFYGGTEGRIISAIISEDGAVSYKVTYWADKVLTDCVIPESMIDEESVKPESMMKVGFH
jgi:hypothetical protein